MGPGLGSGSARPLSGPAGVARLGWLSAQRAMAHRGPLVCVAYGAGLQQVAQEHGPLFRQGSVPSAR